MKAVFKYATGAVAAIPGLVVLVSDLPVPPGKRVLFTTIAESFAVLVVLILMLFWGTLAGKDPGRLVRWVAYALAAFLIALCLYLYLQGRCLIVSDVVEDKEYGPVYFPVYLPGPIGERIKQEGGPQATVNKNGPSVIDQELGNAPGVSAARTITSIVMLLTFVVCSTVLTVAFGLLGARLTPSETTADDNDNTPWSLAGGGVTRETHTVPADDEEPEPPPDCGLPGPLLLRLRNAVVAAFTEDELEQLMRFHLEADLWGIVPRGPRNQVAFRLILWLLRNGRLPEFLGAVEAERPGNAGVVDAVRDVRAVLPNEADRAVEVSSPTPPPTPAPPGSGAGSG